MSFSRIIFRKTDGLAAEEGARYQRLREISKSVTRLFSALVSRKRGPLNAKVWFNSAHPIAEVAEEYLSYSIDISVLVGGFWWEGSDKTRRGLGALRVPPLKLTGKKLDTLTRALAPAVLRIGGSESDNIHYFTSLDGNEPDGLVLTQKMWDSLHDYLNRNQLKLAFTVKYGVFERKQHGNWCGSEVEKLLQYSQERGYRMDVLELGNELNAYWAFHGLTSQPRAINLARDYKRFAEVAKQYFPNAQIIAPGCAFWPKLGETIRPFSNITQRFLYHSQRSDTPIEIINWHYYPYQSIRSPVRTRRANRRSMLNPRAFNDFSKFSKRLTKWRNRYFPEATIWTGETGSAQCGGEPTLSDRFISCFWWADQLGQGGVNGQKVMIRQSLIGGDYGMIDRLTLKPRPDFWLSWLWKRLMGTQVYVVESNHHMLRVYCHNRRGKNDVTLLLINLSSRAMAVDLALSSRVKAQYCITAKSLQSKKVQINGVKARFNKGQFRLKDFPQLPVSNELPGHSISFWVCALKES